MSFYKCKRGRITVSDRQSKYWWKVEVAIGGLDTPQLVVRRFPRNECERYRESPERPEPGNHFHPAPPHDPGGAGRLSRKSGRHPAGKRGSLRVSRLRLRVAFLQTDQRCVRGSRPQSGEQGGRRTGQRLSDAEEVSALRSASGFDLGG